MSDDFFSTLTFILQVKHCQHFTIILLLQMFRLVTFLSFTSSDLHSEDPPCYVHGANHPHSLSVPLTKSFTQNTSYPELLICGISSWENASLTPTIFVNLSPESNNICPIYSPFHMAISLNNSQIWVTLGPCIEWSNGKKILSNSVSCRAVHCACKMWSFHTLFGFSVFFLLESHRHYRVL